MKPIIKIGLTAMLCLMANTIYAQTDKVTEAKKQLLDNREKLLQVKEQLLQNQEELIEVIEKEYEHRMLLLNNMDYLNEKFDYSHNQPIIYIDVPNQMLYLVKGTTILKAYDVSTAKAGVGNVEGSEMTPLGVHYIRTKVGDKVNYGTIFKGLKNTGKEAEIITDTTDSTDDYVTSRVMWLDGKEDDKNNGGMVDTYNRNIYIHGTHEEGLIGTPVSHGCIRMRNADVIELYKAVNTGTFVVIGSGFVIE